ncbi:MAG TPA: glycoside hydrolase family 3 protein, partial [Candidatus Limnocylindria bacterium]|nr:glycoside hydrolase family 3 protein [Candidatus Limnocylindria bacterium]
MALVSLDGGEVDAGAASLLRDYHVGNVIHFGNNVADFGSARRLNAELDGIIRENCAGVPPLVSVDHEGGRVMRFGAGFTWFPSQMALGAADDEALTEAVGRAMGAELRAAGFNLSFSPVLDVLRRGSPGFVGIRAFGASPDAAARHGAAMARGLQGAGVMACAKHFPGHGDTEADSHYGLPKVDKPREALDAMELRPYRGLVGESAADAVMTTHILFPALEPRDVPATMSEATVTGVLRGDLGFTGMVVTDGMQMGAIAAHYGMARGCVEAVKAGCDLLAVGTGGAGSRDAQAACLEAVYRAVLQGEIPMERIDGAVARILRLKEKYCGPWEMSGGDTSHETSRDRLTEEMPGGDTSHGASRADPPHGISGGSASREPAPPVPTASRSHPA